MTLDPATDKNHERPTSSFHNNRQPGTTDREAAITAGQFVVSRKRSPDPSWADRFIDPDRGSTNSDHPTHEESSYRQAAQVHNMVCREAAVTLTDTLRPKFRIGSL